MIQKGFLSQELTYRYPQMRSHLNHTEESVDRPLFFDEGARADDARIYVCSAKQAAALQGSDRGKGLFLCIGEPDGPKNEMPDCCVFPENVNPQILMNFVQRIFDRLDEWDLRLRRIAEAATDCSELLDCASEMLQNPVWMCDESGRLIARAERFGQENVQKECELSYKMMERRPADAPDSEPVPEERVRRKQDEQSGTELLYARFSAGKERFALLSAARERAFYASDETVLERLCGYCRLVLLKRRPTEQTQGRPPQNDRRERLLRAAFERTETESAVTAGLVALGWDGRSSYFVAAAEPSAGDGRESRMRAVCMRTEAALPDCCAFPVDSLAVFVLKGALCGRETVRALEKLAAEEELRIGVGEPFAGYAFFPQRLAQAKIALQSARERGASVTAFSDAADAYLARRTASELPYALVCLGAVREMLRYDQTHGTAYFETAERYVKNRFNAVKTAADLFIHRSTFLYRLERIRSEFGLDLESDGCVSLRLIASLELTRAALNEGRKE